MLAVEVMGTVFLVVDEQHGTYFHLDKWTGVDECPFFDMMDGSPKMEHSLGSVIKAMHAPKVMSIAKCEQLFWFLEQAKWKVALAADCWDTKPDYFKCMRNLECIGSILNVRVGKCKQCEWFGFLLYDPICARCDWKETE